MKRINITLFTLMLLGILFSCTRASINYTQNGNWVGRANWPGVPMGYGVSWVIGTAAYAGLGINPQTPNQRLTSVWKYTVAPINSQIPTGYDSADGYWTQMTDFIGPARSNAVAFTTGGMGYVGSGIGNDGFTPLYDFYSYNYSANDWIRIADFRNPTTGDSLARYDAVAWGFDTVGYVLTGYDNQYYYGDVWAYSPATGQWRPGIECPGNPRSGAISWVYNGKGYLVTGYTPGSVHASNNMAYDFWVYDPTQENNPTTGPWTRLHDIFNTNPATFDDGYTNIVRQHGTGFTILGTATGDKGYVTLGINGTAIQYTWEYDFATDLWTEKTPYKNPARGGAFGFTVENRGFVGAGLALGNSQGYADFEELFPNMVYNQYD
jgi:N-acetylneuraminic acid mutarotase